MARGGFFHAGIEPEQALRAQFERVYSCLQFVRAL